MSATKAAVVMATNSKMRSSSYKRSRKHRKRNNNSESSVEKDLVDIKSRLVSPIPVNPDSAKQPGWPMSYLYSGASFTGHQRSRGDILKMDVQITQVDLAKAELNGHMTIYGLTRENPTLTTYFTGEIVSARYPFLTRKWDVSESIDTQYWGKFSHFYTVARDFNEDTFDYSVLDSMDHVYMRWKEHFFINPVFNSQKSTTPGLVSSSLTLDNDLFAGIVQPRASNVPGVSIDGFYYVCLDKRNGHIEGTYFHNNYNIYLTLNLSHVAQRSIPVYQMR